MDKRLFIDLDGTAAEWKEVSNFEETFEDGFFYNLKPHKNVCEALRLLNERFPEIELYVLSAVSEGALYAIKDKNRWVDKFLPFIPKENRIYSICGKNKADYIPDGIKKTDFLFDDYSVNLKAWHKSGGQGIKILNDKNGTNGTWTGSKIKYSERPMRIMADLADLVLNGHKPKN